MVHKLLRHRGDRDDGAPKGAPRPTSSPKAAPAAAPGEPLVAARLEPNNIAVIINEYEQMIEQTIKKENDLLDLIDKLQEEAGRLNAEARSAKARLKTHEQEHARFRAEAEAEQRRLHAELDFLRNAPQQAPGGAGPDKAGRQGSLLSQARAR